MAGSLARSFPPRFPLFCSVVELRRLLFQIPHKWLFNSSRSVFIALSRSINLLLQADVRPAPRPNKPKPPAKPRLYPVVKALYDYDAQDTDELSFSAGDEIELMQKRKFFTFANLTQLFLLVETTLY